MAVTGYRMLDARCWIRDAGYGMLDIGYGNWVRDQLRSFHIPHPETSIQKPVSRNQYPETSIEHPLSRQNHRLYRRCRPDLQAVEIDAGGQRTRLKGGLIRPRFVDGIHQPRYFTAQHIVDDKTHKRRHG